MPANIISNRLNELKCYSITIKLPYRQPKKNQRELQVAEWSQTKFGGRPNSVQQHILSIQEETISSLKECGVQMTKKMGQNMPVS